MMEIIINAPNFHLSLQDSLIIVKYVYQYLIQITAEIKI